VRQNNERVPLQSLIETMSALREARDATRQGSKEWEELDKQYKKAEAETSNTIELAGEAVKLFLQTYRSIDWTDLHGRLVHFRNRGVAHLTPHKIEKRMTYAELKSLSQAVTTMGECMELFAKGNAIPLRWDEAEEYSERAFAIWKTALA